MYMYGLFSISKYLKNLKIKWMSDMYMFLLLWFLLLYFCYSFCVGGMVRLVWLCIICVLACLYNAWTVEEEVTRFTQGELSQGGKTCQANLKLFYLYMIKNIQSWVIKHGNVSISVTPMLHRSITPRLITRRSVKPAIYCTFHQDMYRNWQGYFCFYFFLQLIRRWLNAAGNNGHLHVENSTSYIRDFFMEKKPNFFYKHKHLS